ncbi:MAG: DEAD/DEAH box helicase family protein [Clostridia bacterium]|nr:DEAD/DEAH box helicase family protein [Clostridia bacterium]
MNVRGKTFIAIYSIAKLGLKPLIIAPTALLKNQWIENFTDLGFDKDDIATNIYDAPKKTFCVVTISAIENELRKDWDGLMKVIDQASFGIKVIDEAHLHLKGVLKFDAICNIKHNWYLSATLGRSDISEDNVLNRALLDADRFVGNNNYEEYQHEYVKIYFQDIYYHPSNKLCNQCFKYGSKGLVISTYYNMLMNYQNGMPFINNIINMTKTSKRICDYGKVLVLVPLLRTIKIVKERMDRDPYFSKFSISTVDGSMSQAEKRRALEQDIILSTTLSMGTGVDVPDLAVVINFDQKKSLIIGEQIFGRLRRRKDDRDCYYIDIADHVKQAKSIWHWATHRRIMMPYYPGSYKDIKRLPNIRC